MARLAVAAAGEVAGGCRLSADVFGLCRLHSRLHHICCFEGGQRGQSGIGRDGKEEMEREREGEGEEEREKQKLGGSKRKGFLRATVA